MVCCLETFCTECGAVLNSTLSSDRLVSPAAGNAPFVVSRQVVAATMDMGVGHAGLVKLCRFLDMEPMHHSSYAKHMVAVSEANKEVVTRLMDDAAITIRQAYRDLDPSISEDDIIDLTVSYDGSWMTRGHKSLYGIGCVVDVVTGLVIDLAVLSLHCQRCSYAKKRYGGTNTPGFRNWHDTHINKCNRNYSGSSGGMEAAAAESLWNRSLERDFRYTTLLSDGDAKTYKHLCDLNIYGDVELQKEECINHVAKRLGTALRKLASSGKKHGVTLGGRGHGKLKQATILKLTAYYGKAVRANWMQCVMLCWRRLIMQHPPMRGHTMIAALWELTAGVSTRSRLPQGRFLDHIAILLARLCRRMLQSRPKVCTGACHAATCFDVACAASPRTPTRVSTPRSGPSAQRPGLSASTELCPPHVPRLPNSTVEWRPRCDTCAV